MYKYEAKQKWIDAWFFKAGSSHYPFRMFSNIKIIRKKCSSVVAWMLNFLKKNKDSFDSIKSIFIVGAIIFTGVWTLRTYYSPHPAIEISIQASQVPFMRSDLDVRHLSVTVEIENTGKTDTMLRYNPDGPLLVTRATPDYKGKPKFHDSVRFKIPGANDPSKEKIGSTYVSAGTKSGPYQFFIPLKSKGLYLIRFSAKADWKEDNDATWDGMKYVVVE